MKLLSLGDLVRENSKITESVMREKNQILYVESRENINFGSEVINLDLIAAEKTAHVGPKIKIVHCRVVD